MARYDLFLVLLLLLPRAQGDTQAGDSAALSAQKARWKNTPPSWIGSDPCGSLWEGITCENSRIVSIVVSGLGLEGTLVADVGLLTQLKTLDLSQNKALTGPLPPAIGNLTNLENLYLVDCNFYGPIPDSVGSLTKLVYLSLASNSFEGSIPSSLGNLINIEMLDITQNNLSGPIPISNSASPGLDFLVKAKHFHFGRNQLSGPIPGQLFNATSQLKHLLIDSNNFTGSIPSTLEQLKDLEVIRFDRNLFTEISVNFSKLSKVSELYLSNNRLAGPIPNLSGMSSLNYLDLSNNSFDASPFPEWASSLQSLTSMLMQRTQLRGPIPSIIFTIPSLETIDMNENRLNGTLRIPASYSIHLKVINLRNNSITGYDVEGGYMETLMLQNNPFCRAVGIANDFCRVEYANSSYSTPKNNCAETPCKSPLISSPNCRCGNPIVGILHFRSVGFSDLGNSTYYVALQDAMMNAFKAGNLPVDSVSLSGPSLDSNGYFDMKLDVFPSGDSRFNRTVFSLITSQLNNITFFTRPPFYGPMFFILISRQYFSEGRSSYTEMIVVTTIGGLILVLLLVLTGIYAFRQRNRAERAAQQIDPFALWDEEGKGSRPEIKGVKSFTLDDIRKFTNNFSTPSILGSGGFGMVYKGTLPNGALVAIKRAQKGSKQGSPEFKNEVELLSRVHHRNLVSLLGFCYEQGELMLIYEYISNGTLKDAIAGSSGIELSWPRRLRLALDSARGLAYLHELVNPPIIHRDVKSANILLDDQLVAKVSDFGFSIPAEDDGSESNQIKGTLGYLDPDYFLTQHPTEKSDVYSFGVIMLELATGKAPVSEGKHIVSEAKAAADKKKGVYNLEKLIDPRSLSVSDQSAIEKFVALAVRCVDESRDKRPAMSEVVKEIESIMQSGDKSGNAEHQEQAFSSSYAKR